MPESSLSMPRGHNQPATARPRGRRLASGWVLAGLVLLLLASTHPCHASLVDYLQLPQVFPEHDLVGVEGERPDWKKEWETGRRLVRSNEYREAAESYRRLVAAKGDIEEARWELALILARLDEWDRAKTELELLAEGSPENVDYLNVLGLALRRTGQAGRALEIFSRVRERSPENFLALVGEAQGLLEAGRKREAMPLIQAVAAKNPEDRDLSLSVIGLAIELGQLETARKYLVPLAASRKADLDLLAQTAKVHDTLGKEKEGAGYWEKCLTLDPANREARERLLRYYEDLGQPDKVLVHLQALLENDPQNITYLSRICQIYTKLALFTEGLPYYEKYVQLRPDDLDFIRSVIYNQAAAAEAQNDFLQWLLAEHSEGLWVFRKLAAEKLTAGNLEGALALWERVARVAPGRIEILRAMDPLLVKLGRESRLVEVLRDIHELLPGDQGVIGRLARLMLERGDVQAGLEYYNLLEQAGYTGSDLYGDRSAIYEMLNQPMQAVADYERLLAITPERQDVRRRVMELAGELGAVGPLVRLVSGLEDVAPGEERAQQMLLLAEAFAQSRDFARAAKYYKVLVVSGSGDNNPGVAGGAGDSNLRLVRRARLGLVDLYRREGLVFEAEQLLREGLLVEEEQAELLFRLFDLALAASPPDLESAKVWLKQYSILPQVNRWQSDIMQARFLGASGEYSVAEGLLRNLFTQRVGADRKNADNDALIFRQAGLALTEVYLEAGDQAAAEQQCLAMLRNQTDRDILAWLAKIYVDADEAKAADRIMQRLTVPEEDGFRLLELAELFEKRGLPGGQFAAADRVWAKWPESYRAGFLRAEALRREGKTAEALAASEALGERFPDLAAGYVLKAQVNFQGGFYRQAADQCRQVLNSTPGRMDIRLLLLRSELAMLNYPEATRLLQEWYPVEAADYLKKLLVDATLPVPQPHSKRTLWQVLTFQREPFFDLVGEVLSARAFFEAIPERRRKNEVVSPEIAGLRWEQVFRATVSEAVGGAQGEGKLAKKK